MSRPIVPVLVLLAATGWAVACGDGTTDPPPPEPPRAATLTVTPATAELTALGSTERFSARVLDQHGQAMAAAAVAWSSGDASVATVDAAGLATAAGNGTATITATSGSASGSAAVTVEQAVSAVAVSPAADTLVARGDTVRLTAAASDANGHAVAGAEFVWASGDTTVATVDASGLATGVGAGEAEVTATASGIAGGAALTVVNAAPMAIAVMPDAVALTALGQTARIAAEVRDQIGRVMEGVPVSWSSSDTTVAAVDSAGLVRAVGGGSTEVTASAGDARGGALVTVTQSAGSVVVSPAADTVAPGDTVRLTAEAFDANGHPVEGAEFAWSSMERCRCHRRRVGTGDGGRGGDGDDCRHRRFGIRNVGDHCRQPGSGRAGGALPSDGRVELDEQRELAYGRAARPQASVIRHRPLSKSTGKAYPDCS